MRVIQHKSATVYDTTTRSMLEARWAIFFRELGLKWKYEPTTLHHKGVSYTPDFEVDGLGYVEIKPTLELFIAETAERLSKIAASFPEHSFYVFCCGHVSLVWGTALYKGTTIYAPTVKQMCVAITKARGITLSIQATQDAYIRRAETIANGTRLTSEWKTPKDVLPEVIDQILHDNRAISNPLTMASTTASTLT